MVDEQVRQGNPADPSVFARASNANGYDGGFSWIESVLGYDFWVDIIWGKKFHLILIRQNSDERVEPHAIIQHMLDNGMDVWVCVSVISYDDARAKIGQYVYRVTKYYTDNCYPVRTLEVGWKYAVPIDMATMTEITEVPK